jgi:hypothetical protein
MRRNSIFYYTQVFGKGILLDYSKINFAIFDQPCKDIPVGAGQQVKIGQLG